MTHLDHASCTADEGEGSTPPGARGGGGKGEGRGGEGRERGERGGEDHHKCVCVSLTTLGDSHVALSEHSSRQSMQTAKPQLLQT